MSITTKLAYKTKLEAILVNLFASNFQILKLMILILSYFELGPAFSLNPYLST